MGDNEGCCVCINCCRSYNWNEPPRTAVGTDKIRICIAGNHVSPHTGAAHVLASYIADRFPDKYETWFHFVNCCELSEYLVPRFEKDTFPDELKGHSSAPFIWLETTNEGEKQTGMSVDNKKQFLGGRDKFVAWVQQQPELMADTDIAYWASEPCCCTPVLQPCFCCCCPMQCCHDADCCWCSCCKWKDDIAPATFMRPPRPRQMDTSAVDNDAPNTNNEPAKQQAQQV